MIKEPNKWEKRRVAFKAGLAKIIAGIIREYRADGTVAVGEMMLVNASASRAARLDGFPLGTNAPWVFREMFREVVADYPAARKFILAEGGAK